jgi:hypothetical protein
MKSVPGWCNWIKRTMLVLLLKDRSFSTDSQPQRFIFQLYAGYISNNQLPLRSRHISAMPYGEVGFLYRQYSLYAATPRLMSYHSKLKSMFHFLLCCLQLTPRLISVLLQTPESYFGECRQFCHLQTTYIARHSLTSHNLPFLLTGIGPTYNWWSSVGS